MNEPASRMKCNSRAYVQSAQSKYSIVTQCGSEMRFVAEGKQIRMARTERGGAQAEVILWSKEMCYGARHVCTILSI